MTVAQSLVFDAIDAYLAVHATAWPDLQDAGVIYDGPAVATPTDTTYAIVGCDDPTADGFTNVVDSGQQEWWSDGASRRQEQFIIWSTLVVWSGDTDFAALRAEAKDRINDLGSALRPPPRGTGDAMLDNVLNQNGAGTGWCGLTVARLRAINTNGGAAIHVPYALAVTAYI